jgi:hypothetical protein
MNYIFNVKDSKSINGYIFILGEAIMSWKSSKKTCIVRFMIKLEFIILDKIKKKAK